MYGKFQRIFLGSGAESCPVRVSIFVHGTYLEVVSGFYAQPFEQQFRILNGTIVHAIKLYFIIVGIIYLVPSGLQGISCGILFGNLCFRGNQRT